MTNALIRSARAGLLVVLVGTSTAQAQPVSVTAADPPQGEQSTVGLVVRITGKNFASGARVDFFRSGTSETAGVVVRSAVVTKATEIQATVDIAPEAALSFFDIRVTNLSGRSGKGSDLFQVVQKVSNNCVLAPLPANVVLLGQLNSLVNGAPVYTGELGVGFNVRAVELRGQMVLMVAAPADPGIEVFFISPGVGGAVDVDAVNPHRRLTVPSLPSIKPAVIGDFNGDQLPDIVARNGAAATFVVFLGYLDATGDLAFGPAIISPPPAVAEGFGVHLAAGDLDPAYPGDEIAVGQSGSRQGNKKHLGRIHLYRVSGGTIVPLSSSPIIPALDPPLELGEGFGGTFVIGDVTGGDSPDLIVSASTRDVNRVDWAGEIYVFPSPTFDTAPLAPGLQPHVIRAHTAREQFGFGLGTGDVNNDGVEDVLSATFYNSPIVAVDIALGAIGPSHVSAAAYSPIVPQGGAVMGFASGGLIAGDVDGDGLVDLAVGAPSATSGIHCDKAGALFLWRGTGRAEAPWHEPQVIQAPTVDADRAHFAWHARIARLGTQPVLIVGERWRDLGGVSQAGQIYLYRVTSP